MFNLFNTTILILLIVVILAFIFMLLQNIVHGETIKTLEKDLQQVLNKKSYIYMDDHGRTIENVISWRATESQIFLVLIDGTVIVYEKSNNYSLYVEERDQTE